MIYIYIIWRTFKYNHNNFIVKSQERAILLFTNTTSTILCTVQNYWDFVVSHGTIHRFSVRASIEQCTSSKRKPSGEPTLNERKLYRRGSLFPWFPVLFISIVPLVWATRAECHFLKHSSKIIHAINHFTDTWDHEPRAGTFALTNVPEEQNSIHAILDFCVVPPLPWFPVPRLLAYRLSNIASFLILRP